MVQVVVAITSGATWLVPADYGLPSMVDCIGSGATGTTSSTGGRGGGGGAFARKNNVVLTPHANIPIQVGLGESTWLLSTTTVLAAAAIGGTGGQASACVGDLVYSGGNANSPGGGAAGAQGVGGNAVVGQAGAGNNGHGGAGGSTASGGVGNPGQDGHEVTLTGGTTVGSGGGGGWSGAAAGSFGGGGAGNNTPFTAGLGRQGIIIVTYTSTTPTNPGSHRRVGVAVSG